MGEIISLRANGVSLWAKYFVYGQMGRGTDESENKKWQSSFLFHLQLKETIRGSL
ncbi:hypothetical protein [Bacillus coahuilensis]|uniref:hypothetical protein n=1 Tax=Bacillus coahuilensis TaxID=408580 RepID=UPI000A42E7A9|nr:hypothetical protein [Bacillus coahuilensis]